MTVPAISMKRASSSNIEPRINRSASMLAGRPLSRAVFSMAERADTDMAVSDITLPAGACGFQDVNKRSPKAQADSVEGPEFHNGTAGNPQRHFTPKMFRDLS